MRHIERLCDPSEQMSSSGSGDGGGSGGDHGGDGGGRGGANVSAFTPVPAEQPQYGGCGSDGAIGTRALCVESVLRGHRSLRRAAAAAFVG